MGLTFLDEHLHVAASTSPPSNDSISSTNTREAVKQNSANNCTTRTRLKLPAKPSQKVPHQTCLKSQGEYIWKRNRNELTDPCSRQDWADDEDLDDTVLELPAPTTTTNKDGTKTIITWRFNDDGKKVKTTRRIRLTTHKEVVNPRVAERKQWSKFGLSEKDSVGPALDTTTVGENIIFRPSTNWRKDAKEEKTEVGSMEAQLKGKKVKCRICNGEHFTARCPFKDTMAPVGEDGAAGDTGAGGAGDSEVAGGGLGVGKSSYVPPHMRSGGAGAGDKMGGGGKFERDDLATLRVTNVSRHGKFHILRKLLIFYCRYLRWLKNMSFEICLRDLVVSLVSSSQRTESREWQRALLSFHTKIAPMPSKLLRRWMALVSSI